MLPSRFDPAFLLVLLGTLVIALALVAGARGGARALGLGAASTRTVTLATGSGVALWILLVSVFAVRGDFVGGARSAVPPIAFGLLLPIATVIAVFAGWPTARRVLAAVPQSRLIGVQVYRVLGGVFLLLLAQHRIPAEFAQPAGWGDLFIGGLALFVARAVRSPGRGARAAAAAWNVVGGLDLVIAVTTGVLTAPGPLHRLALSTPNTIIATFPLVLIPTVLVPVSLLLHGVSLYRLRTDARASSSSVIRPRLAGQR